MKTEPERESTSGAIELASRVLAICLFMVLPGLLGTYLDKKFSTGYWTPIGVVVGMVFGLAGLILVLNIKEAQEKSRAGQSPKETPGKSKYRKIEDWNEPEDGSESEPKK